MIEVEFPVRKSAEPAKGTAGLTTHIGGVCTTVSVLREAGMIKNA